MQKLTKAEEELMLIFWEIEEGVIRDVIERLKDHQTPYTTVSTVVRVLEKKGFLNHRVIGNTHLYYPVISKEEYLKDFFPGILRKYFGGSFAELASFFARENDLSLKELSGLIDTVGDELREKHEKDKKDE